MNRLIIKIAKQVDGRSYQFRVERGNAGMPVLPSTLEVDRTAQWFVDFLAGIPRAMLVSDAGDGLHQWLTHHIPYGDAITAALQIDPKTKEVRPIFFYLDLPDE